MLTDYRVKAVVPDMTEAAFLAVLRGAGSPVGDGEARAVYSYCLSRGFSPAALLAWFNHESGMGKNGWAVKTKSWGNTRPPSFGVPDDSVYDQDGGGLFPPMPSKRPAGRRYLSRYLTWADGGVSTVARFFDHAPYQGKNTVREIVPTWAPSSDGNNVENYITKVLADIERWATPQETPSMDALAPLATRQILMPASNKNWGQTTMRGGWPSWITVHETGNTKPGANAEMHARFVGNGGGRDIERGGQVGGVSFQAVVDEVESIQIMPWNAVAWHASDGDGDGNFDSIAIETCQIGNFAKTVKNLAILIAKLMKEFAIPLDHVVQHNHWAPDKKNCPEFMRRNSNALWNGLIAAVKVATSLPAPTASGVVTPAIDWDGEGEIVASGEYVIARNAAGQVYQRRRTDGTLGPWVKLTA